MATGMPNAAEDHFHLQPVIDSLPVELTAAKCKEVTQFIKKYSTVFSPSKFDLGHTSLVTHHIYTGMARPIRQGLCRHLQKYMEVIDAEIEKMAVSRGYRACMLPVGQQCGRRQEARQHAEDNSQLPPAEQCRV